MTGKFKKQVAKPLGNGAVESVTVFLGLPSEEDKTIYEIIDTDDFEELFDLAEYRFTKFKKRSKFNKIDAFLLEEVKRAKMIQSWFANPIEKEYYYPLSDYIAYLENHYRRLCKPDIKDIDAIIHYYNNVRINPVFTTLQNTLQTVQLFLTPIQPQMSIKRYFDFFLKEIDFDKTNKRLENEIGKEYCQTIFYGLEYHFKRDIDKIVLDFQNNIPHLTTSQIKDIQIKLITSIGNLKRQSQNNGKGTSFSERYLSLIKSIESKKFFLQIDYQIIVGHFNETIVNDLLNTFTIINDTLSQITLLANENAIETKLDKSSAKQINDIDVSAFFNSIRESDITKIEIYNTLEKITDGFNVDKLKIVLDDFGFYLMVEKDKRQSDFSEDDIDLAIQELADRGKEIPLKNIPGVGKDKNNKFIKIPDANKVLDIEALLYPYEFFSCYQFKVQLTELIKTHSRSINSEELNKTDNALIEPQNAHKRIFVNGFAYEFFEKLRSEIIKNPKHNYADYSFILPKMIKDKYLIETNQLKLIQFLDKHYGTKIEVKYPQFKTSEADYKKQIYSRLNKEYKSKINSIL